MSRNKRFAIYGAIVATFIAVLVAAKFGMSYRSAVGEPIDITEAPWSATVTRGQMMLDVRGTGTLTRSSKSRGAVVKAEIREITSDELRLNQQADVDTRNGFLRGRVVAIEATDPRGTRNVEIILHSVPGELPQNLHVDVTIEISNLRNVLYVGRPVHANANSSLSVFRMADDGESAERVTVRFGRAAVNTIEVLDGLKEGDRIILGDMSAWDGESRINLK